MLLYAELLFLLIVANGVPVLAWRLLGSRYATRIDFDKRFVDGKPLFGTSKTWRGVILSILITCLIAILLGFDWQFGAGFAAAAMAGDLLSSFIKRRLDLESSSMALGIDQIPESLFPLLLAFVTLRLDFWEVALLVLLFFVSELLLSRVLYRLKIRKEPY